MAAWYARPDDVIVGKLLAWDEGRSAKHPYDIAAMLAFLYQAQDPTIATYFDEKYVDQRARTISSTAASLWQRVKREAKRKSKKSTYRGLTN